MGYQSLFPQAVAFASNKYCGTGVQHLKALQITMQLDYLVKHIQTDTDSGKTVVCMLCWAQQCAGTATSIVEDTAPLPYLEGT
eukprot:6418302-Ditylum_brightwellii.AAC.1